MRELLLSELQVLQRTEHKNLMPVVEILEDNNDFFLICELATGKDLQHRLESVTTFSEKQAAIIIKQVLEGLNYMHKMGVMHRDIKPANILMNSRD